MSIWLSLCLFVGQLLVVHGASINALNNEGYSPLHIAALNRWYDNAATLVQLGTSVLSWPACF